MIFRLFRVATVSFMVFRPFGIEPCSAANREVFEIGAYLAPPAIPAHRSSSEHWRRIQACSIDTMIGAEDSHGKATLEPVIANADRHGIKLLVTDPTIYDRRTLDTASYAYWDVALAQYVRDSRVKGFVLRDEPQYSELEGLANSYRRIKGINANWEVMVNLALAGGPYSTNEPNPVVISNPFSTEWGKYLVAESRLGQSITIPHGVFRISEVELRLDPIQWPPGDELTLVVWDSPARRKSYGRASVREFQANPLRFVFPSGIAVAPEMKAYFELTHDATRGAMGRFARSMSNTYRDGAAFEQGKPQDYDLYFRVRAQRNNLGDGYENIIDDWVTLSGADQILSTTVYPWRGNADAAEYFSALERLRGRGLAHGLPIGLFLQLVQVTDVRSGAVTYRDPSLAMMRWNGYSALAYGAKRLRWFLYWPPARVNGYFEVFSQTPVSLEGVPLPKYDTLRSLNRELHHLGSVMKRLTSRRVFHSGRTLPPGVRPIPEAFFVHPTDGAQPLVIGHFTDRTNRSYLLVMNRSYEARLDNVELRFNRAPTSITEVDKRDGREHARPHQARGTLRFALESGEGRLFAMNRSYRPYANLAAAAKVTASSSVESSLQGLGLEKVNDDIRVGVPGAMGWSSQNVPSSVDTQWIAFEFERSRQIAAVKMFPWPQGEGFPEQFVIETSSNGFNWTEVARGQGMPVIRGAIEHSFPPRVARFLRIRGTRLRKTDAQFRMQLSEVEIYETGSKS